MAKLGDDGIYYADRDIITTDAQLAKYCPICNKSFTIQGINDSRLFCPNCQEALKQLVEEQQELPSSDEDQGCDTCYYEDWDENAYPCSMCIRGYRRKDQWRPKGGR